MKPSKSIHLKDDIHMRISKIQLQLEEIGIKKTLYEITDVIMRHGVDNVFELIKNNETSEGES